MTVRPATPADAEVVAEIYRFYVTDTAITFDEAPLSADDFVRRIDAGGLPFLVAEREGQVVGYITAAPHGARASFRWSVNSMIYVRPGLARGGVGRALYAGLLPRLTALNYVRVYAGITLPNAPSVGLHEALGFRRVATFPAAGYKLGRWWDVGWWELPLVPLPEHPAEPLATPGGR
jgi:phosphinothricin acetyltransferase